MSRIRRLRQLWAEVPQIECRGLCWDSCGPVSGSTLEIELAERAGGGKLDVRPHPLAGGTPMCTFLSPEGRCRIYMNRPMICRLWGVTEGLRCHHGCEPMTEPLSDAEGMKLLARSLKIGGDVGGLPPHVIDSMIEMLDDGTFEVRGSNVMGRTTIAFVDHRERR